MSDTGRQPRDPAPDDDVAAAVPAAHGDLQALRFRRIVESLPLAVYLDQPNVSAASLYVGPQIEAMFGYPAERWAEDAFFESILHPDDREDVLRQHEDVFAAKLDRWSFRYRIVAADGRVVWVRDDAVVITDDAGEPEYVQGFLIDISEEMEREAARTTAEYRYRRLVENLPLAVYLDRPTRPGPRSTSALPSSRCSATPPNAGRKRRSSSRCSIPTIAIGCARSTTSGTRGTT